MSMPRKAQHHQTNRDNSPVVEPKSGFASSARLRSVRKISAKSAALLDEAHYFCARTLARTAAVAAKKSGKGSGASIKGSLLTKLYPKSFARELSRVEVAGVSGTNGKTTTTHLLTAARKTLLDADFVVTNQDGANLHRGMVSVISDRPDAKAAILETDERVVPDLIKYGQPKVLALLNLSRDQMDRNFELNLLTRSWRDALKNAGNGESTNNYLGPVVVANLSDPNVAWAASAAKHVRWIDTGTSLRNDAALCPNCGEVLCYETDPQNNRWWCQHCSFEQPKADFRVDSAAKILISKTGEKYPLELELPGRFNVVNAAFALVAAMELGCDPYQALAAFKTVSSPAGRFSVIDFGNCQARLILAKNPAGWAESLALAETKTLVLPIDAQTADGKDPSWLWDVDFEQLAGRQIICTGPRAYDLAVRLAYAGVDYRVVPNLVKAFSEVDGPVDVVTTYTPFQKLLSIGGAR